MATKCAKGAYVVNVVVELEDSKRIVVGLRDCLVHCRGSVRNSDG